MSKPIITGAIAAAFMLGLTACSEADSPSGDVNVLAGENLAEVLGDAGGLTMMASAMEQTGIGSIFEGPASYTVFAPTDEAFESLDDNEMLMSEDGKPILTAILRDHMAAGHLTPENITEAVAAENGTLELKTLGDSVLTFRELDGQMVIESDGIQARLAGDASAARNGVIIPIDRILVNTEAD